MDSTSLWGLITVIAGLIVGAAGVWATASSYRRTNPKRRLTIVTRTTALVSGKVPLTVAHEGVPVAKPHTVEFTLFSDSRADIPSVAFDDKRPVKLQFPSRIVTVISVGAEGIDSSVDEWEILVPPQLIRPGSRLEMELLVDGPVDSIEIGNTLIDIPVDKVDGYEHLTGGSRARDLAAAIVGIVGMSFVAALLLTSAATPLIAVAGLAANIFTQLAEAMH